eukprot:6457572-Prymnesium_polylepis.2
MDFARGFDFCTLTFGIMLFSILACGICAQERAGERRVRGCAQTALCGLGSRRAAPQVITRGPMRRPRDSRHATRGCAAALPVGLVLVVRYPRLPLPHATHHAASTQPERIPPSTATWPRHRSSAPSPATSDLRSDLP